MFSLSEFTSRDGVPETDRPRYNQLTAAFEADLRPTGGLEICLAAEILRATWRIHRYAAIDDSTLPDDAARADLNRTRAAAAKSLRWGISELRNLQTNREIQQKLGINLPGIADIRQILKFTGSQPRTEHPAANSTKRTQSEHVASAESLILAKLADVQNKERSILGGNFAEITERTQSIPRNAPCTCGSGQKYKRCCGKDAPPQLNLSPELNLSPRQGVAADSQWSGDWLKNLRTAA